MTNVRTPTTFFSFFFYLNHLNYSVQIEWTNININISLRHVVICYNWIFVYVLCVCTEYSIFCWAE